MRGESLTLAGLAAQIQSGSLTPTEVVSRILDRVEKTNRTYNAFITVLKERALGMAADAEKEIRAGRYRGPLHGIPVSLADVIQIQGVRCTAGSRILAENVAEHDATVTGKLREAGAVIIGTNNMDEFGIGVTGFNPHYGPVLNPWNPEYLAGGCSGGSAAAVAAGLAAFSLGVDAGGSVRIPAALCGVVGLKPTYGRVSKHGIIPVSWSLDHIGILAKTVRDAAIVLRMVAGYDSEDESSVYVEVHDYLAELERSVEGLKVCMLGEVKPVSREVMSRLRQFVGVLESLGITVEEVELDARQVKDCWSTIMLSEAAAFHDKLLTTREGDYGRDVAEALRKGSRITAVDYIKALKEMSALKNIILKTLDSYRAIISPTTPITAVKKGEESVEIDGEKMDVYTALTSQTMLYNLAGIPAITIPAGLSSEGLPVGMQIAGRLFDEATILRIGHQALEKMKTSINLPQV
ncbi:MAG: amidase [Candidatus Caldarchaeum sp.]|uniref:Amidase n=1 Tax=Caldiarchaeum subterraneum TaxID=311458 RepID=A0A7C5L732_CALS0